MMISIRHKLPFGGQNPKKKPKKIPGGKSDNSGDAPGFPGRGLNPKLPTTLNVSWLSVFYKQHTV